MTNKLTTTLYTLTYTQVNDIFEELKTNSKEPIISDNLYNLIVNNKTIILNCDINSPSFSFKSFYDMFFANTDFQKEIIISRMKFILLNFNYNDNDITFSLKQLFQDIGFCIRILFYELRARFLNDIYSYEYNYDIRILYFLNLIEKFSHKGNIHPVLFNLATNSAKIKDTIIVGYEDFRENILSLNLNCDRINELEDDELDSFFQKPYLEEEKYKIVKYFIICEFIDFKNKYLNIFKNLSSLYGFAYIFLVQYEDINDIKNDLSEQLSVIYFSEEEELKEIYKDNNERLRPRLREYLPENISSSKLLYNKIQEKLMYTGIEALKSSSEDGWDLFKSENDFKQLFLFNINSPNFQDFIRHIIENIIKAYDDYYALNIFFKYYSNYFFLTLQPQFVVNMTAFVKMFLYAYTLEEGDKNKNLYCIINDDLRSCIPEKINRYIELIKVIGTLIKTKKIKSYRGIVYRASFIKEELISKLNIDDKIINSAFWSSTKKESVAKKFLKDSHKNTLIIVKGELINNIDIHAEKISRYPSEEEVLFLPFCQFNIKNIEIINENEINYYQIILESFSESSLIEPQQENLINKYNFEKIEDEDEEEDNIL